jgi:hypothetical protein
VGWFKAGEWLEYTLEVIQTGAYQTAVRVGSKLEGRTFHIEIDGVDVTGPLVVPVMEDWDQYETLVLEEFQLEAGLRLMRVVMGPEDYMDLNWVEFCLPGNDGDPTCDSIDEDCDGQTDEDADSSGACDDGVYCNGIETCGDGICLPGTPAESGLICGTATCHDGVLQPAPVCDGQGSCQPVDPVPCPTGTCADEQSCEQGQDGALPDADADAGPDAGIPDGTAEDAADAGVDADNHAGDAGVEVEVESGCGCGTRSDCTPVAILWLILGLACRRKAP